MSTRFGAPTWAHDLHTLPLVLDLIDSTDVVVRIDAWTAADRPEKAAKRREPYPTRSLLALLLLVSFAGKPITVANLFNLTWWTLSRAELRALDLHRIITTKRRDGLGRPLKNSRPWRTELAHFRTALARVCDILDPSPFRQMFRAYNWELDEKRASLTEADRARLARNRDRLLEVCNILIGASARIAGDRVTAETGHDWRDTWHGDVVIDGHMVAVAQLKSADPARPQGRHGYDPDSGLYLKHRKHGPVWAHQLVLTMTTHRTYEQLVPSFALAMSIGKPSAGDVDLMTDAIRGARAHAPTPTKPHRPRLITDMGFSIGLEFARSAYELGYDPVMEYPEHHRVVQPLGNGAYLFNGVPVCPEFLDRLKNAAPGELPAFHAEMTDAQFRRQLQFERLAAAATMPKNARWTPSFNGPNYEIVNGRKVPLPGVKAGRPGPTPLPILWKSRIPCPAKCQLCRCSRVPDTMSSHDPHSFLTATSETPPRDPNGDIDTRELPYVCGVEYAAARLDAAGFKQAQEFMRGTWKHHDIYCNARSNNERFHSQLTHQSTGALGLNSRHMTGTVRVALVTMGAVIVTNLKSADAFIDRVHTNGGKLPWCARLAEKRSRDDRETRLQRANNSRHNGPRAA